MNFTTSVSKLCKLLPKLVELKSYLVIFINLAGKIFVHSDTN